MGKEHGLRACENRAVRKIFGSKRDEVTEELDKDEIYDPIPQQLLFVSIINQLDAQNLFHNNFYFMPVHVSSTCAHHQEVKIALHSLWYHHTYRCDDTRGCDLLMISTCARNM